MPWIPGPAQVAREAAMLTALPRGVAGLAWRWLTDGAPVRHVEEDGDHHDLPPVLSDQLRHDQPVEAGVGPVLHRTFRTRVCHPRLLADELVDVLAGDMNRLMVPGVARFDHVAGSRTMAVGDELVVRMPGPWDGPVRVVHRDGTSFRLATLAGHLEAGQIEFAAHPGPPRGDELGFSVTTWARAGDRVADLLYNHLGVAKEIQFQLWVHACLQAGRLSGGRPTEGVEVRTRRVLGPDDRGRGGPDGATGPV